MKEVVSSCEQVTGYGLALKHCGIEKGCCKLNKRIKTWEDLVGKFKYLPVRCTLHAGAADYTGKILT